MNHYFESRIPADEFTELKQQIEKLKQPDFKKNRNTLIVDLDMALEILIEHHVRMLNQKRGFVEDIFNAFDVQFITSHITCLVFPTRVDRPLSFLPSHGSLR